MNRRTVISAGERIIFMDRLRLMLVIIVVFMHSACAYSNMIPWWSVQEMPKSQALDLFVLFVDGFQMPLLFFISGYFTYFSINKRPRMEFIISKFKRIGLPFVAVGLFLTPYISYMGIRRLMTDAPGFFSFWKFQMKTAIDFKLVLFSDMETALKHWMDYSDWHLWFVFVLLGFYMIYAAYDFLKEKIKQPGTGNKKFLSVSAALGISFFIMGLLYAIAYTHVIDWVWGKTLIFSAQPVRLPVYFCIFFLGVYAGKAGWFVERDIPGKTWLWGLSSLVFSVLLILCMFYMFTKWGKPGTFSFGLVHGFIRAGVIISALCFLVKFMSGIKGRPGVADMISGYTYEIYIIHLPIVIAIAYLFTFITIPVFLKFVFVGTIVTSLSYGLARYLIKPYPKTATALITTVFVLLCLVYR